MNDTTNTVNTVNTVNASTETTETTETGTVITTAPTGVEYFDETGKKAGTVHARAWTLEQIQNFSDLEAEFSASLLFPGTMPDEVIQAWNADTALKTESDKTGTALRQLVGASLAPVVRKSLIWHGRHPGEMAYSHWAQRPAERQSRPTVGGVLAFFIALLEGGSSSKVTAADTLRQWETQWRNHRTGWLSLTEELPDGEHKIKAQKLLISYDAVLDGSRLGDEEKKILRRALKPKPKA